MAIPDTPQFQQLLSSISRVDPGLQDYDSILIRAERGLRHPDGQITSQPPLEIWYRNDTDLSMDSLLKKLRQELDHLDQPSTDQIARTILLLLTFHPDQSTDSIAALNAILALPTRATASQFVLMDMDAEATGFPSISFGDFSFDLMDPKRLSYKCEKAGSGYFRLYEQHLIGKPWIERKRFATTILNLFRFSYLVRPKDKEEFPRAADSYFETVAEALFDEFWVQFNEQQDMHISLGFGILSEKLFRDWFSSEHITIFLDIDVNGKNWGFVVPALSGQFEVQIPEGTGSSIRQLRNDIEKQYDYPGKGSGEISGTIRTFTKFIAKGYRYLLENKKDDGFLHFIIALDLLFGDKQESTRTVANRCALLTFAHCERSYSEQKKLLNNAYDLRSKYVHAGLSIQEQYIEQVKPICQEVLYCLLRLHKNNVTRATPLTIDQWKKKLDLAWNAMEADEPLQSQLRLEIGLPA